MNWLYYLLEANLYMSIFYIGYCLFLNKETHYTLNRAYLLGSCLLAFILPFLQLGILKHPAGALHALPAATVNFIPAQQQQFVYAPVSHSVVSLGWQDYALCFYLCGIAVLLALFVFKLYRLYLLSRSKLTRANDYKLVKINGSHTAFSFFNYLFIGTDLSAAETIIRHELVHIRQKHSADIVFIEVLKIINWFNPFIYFLQMSLKAVHEYIADEQTTNGADVLAYSTFLVNNAYGLSGSSITHSFFNYNLLKKRIIMLHQKRSGSLAMLKYLVAVPIFGALLCVSTLAFSKTYGFDLLPGKTDTVHLAPPPPPAPPAGNHRMPPPPPVPPVNPKMVQFPAPNPPSETTSKGYKYAESGYLINGKSNFRVIIVDNGVQKAYFKNSATPAMISLLKNKYGYTFPTMPIYPKLPPPPPMPPVAPKAGKIGRYPPPVVVPDSAVAADPHRLPPPPPMPPKAAKLRRYPPPVVVPDSAVSAKQSKLAPLAPIAPMGNPGAMPPPPPSPAPPVKGSKRVTFTSADPVNDQQKSAPVIVINGAVYTLKQPFGKGQKLIVDAGDSVHAVMYTGKDLQQAEEKYGEGAKNGVIYGYGKTTVEVKPVN